MVYTIESKVLCRNESCLAKVTQRLGHLFLAGDRAYRAFRYATPGPSAGSIPTQSLAVETRQSFSYEPATRPGVKAGDTIVVTSDAAKLMRRTEAVVSVPKGQKLLITAVQPSWLSASVIVNGKTYSGWISATDVQLVPTAPAALH